MVAKCRHCNSLIDLKQFVTHEDTGWDHSQVPEPSGLRVDDSGPGLRIVYRWFSFVFIFMAFFCIAWDSFLVFWYSMALGGNIIWLMVVFPVAHVAIGVGMTYTTLAGFLNHTTVTVDGELLTIRHGPLPWWGNQTLYTDTLNQLYTQQKTSGTSEGTSFSYNLCALTKDGRKFVLISRLPEKDQTLFIEQRVEKHLGIEHRHVPGEVSC